jgi:F420H(2)-dependent quinone reductase
MMTIKLMGMAYLKPPWFTAKVFNKIAMAFGIGGSETLTVTKRGSKEPQEIPVVVPEVDGVKYLVSTRGESAWVLNVRADPKVKLGQTNYIATEVPVEKRAPIITVYRPLAGKVVEGYWKQLPDDVDHPVFALTPA